MHTNTHTDRHTRTHAHTHTHTHTVTHAHKHARTLSLSLSPSHTQTRAYRQTCTTTAARQSGTSQREANIFSLQPSVSPRLIAQRTLQSPSSSRYREYRLVQRPLNTTRLGKSSFNCHRDVAIIYHVSYDSQKRLDCRLIILSPACP